MKFKNIIFDFDGVLAESIEIKSMAFYKMYIKYGDEVAKKVLDHHNKNGAMSRFEKFPLYHNNFLGIKLSNEQVKILSREFSKIVVEDVIKSKEVKGAEWFLNKYDDLKKWVVSATPDQEIKDIIKNRNLNKFFLEVYGSPKKKPEIVKYILGKNNLNPEETIFLGDAIGDYQAASLNGVKFGLRLLESNKELFKGIKYETSFDDYRELDKNLNTKS